LYRIRRRSGGVVDERQGNAGDERRHLVGAHAEGPRLAERVYVAVRQALRGAADRRALSLTPRAASDIPALPLTA
jgi:hypothetical protein